MASVGEAADEQLWGELFDLIDQNEDGYLSWEEFTCHEELDGKQEIQDAIETFKAADANGDGKVGRDEFVKLMTEAMEE